MTDKNKHFLDLWEEKAFIGQDYLTWLWARSEYNSGFFNIAPLGEIEVHFLEKLVLEVGSGNYRQMVSCQGSVPDSKEAKTALKEGKKVVLAKVRIYYQDKEWILTLKYDLLSPQSCRLPKTFEEAEEEEGELSAAGKLLERLALARELTAVLDGLFKKYLNLRLSQDWPEELRIIKEWLKEK